MRKFSNPHPSIIIALDENQNQKVEVFVHHYKGNILDAKKSIEGFCKKHNVTYAKRKKQYNYADLTIDDKTYAVDPFGLDIKSMMKYCGLRPEKELIINPDESEAQAVVSPKRSP